VTEFLRVEDVLYVHADQVSRYGGTQGVRDAGLLASAVAQARASFGGQYLHHDPFEMAAAYLFHLVQGHPFLDGNKRTGLVAALVFLALNGVDVRVTKGRLHDLTLRVATGKMNKTQVAAFFRQHASRVR
jgi:death-on-curing protein